MRSTWATTVGARTVIVRKLKKCLSVKKKKTDIKKMKENSIMICGNKRKERKKIEDI